MACLALPEGKCGSILKDYSCMPHPGTCAVTAGGTNANCAGATTDADCANASTAGGATATNVCVWTGRFSTFQNPDFLFRNPDLLIRDPDFLLNNVDLIIKHSTSDRLWVCHNNQRRYPGAQY